MYFSDDINTHNLVGLNQRLIFLSREHLKVSEEIFGVGLAVISGQLPGMLLNILQSIEQIPRRKDCLA